MNFPSELKYTKDHEWLRIEGNTGIVGITDFAQGELSDVVYVEITTKGESVRMDQIFGTVEAVKAVSDLHMPVSGEVLEINPKLDKQPELVNKDPYGEGWMIKIKITDPAEITALLNDMDYKALTGVK